MRSESRSAASAFAKSSESDASVGAVGAGRERVLRGGDLRHVLRLELLAVRIEIALRLRTGAGGLRLGRAFHLRLNAGDARTRRCARTSQRGGNRRVFAVLITLALGREQRIRAFGGRIQLRFEPRLFTFEIGTRGEHGRHDRAQVQRRDVVVILRELSVERMLLHQVVHTNVPDPARTRRRGRRRCGRTVMSTGGEQPARGERQQSAHYFNALVTSAVISVPP